MARPVGSIIVADGFGGVKAINPASNNNLVLCIDSNNPDKITYKPIDDIASDKYFKINIPDKISAITTRYFTVVSRFTLHGENIYKTQNINILSYANIINTVYHVRLYDVSNNTIISNNIFSNSTLQVNKLSPLSNLPKNTSIIELQVKIDTIGIANISELTIYYK